MKFDELTPDNWTIFAIKNYNNPQSVTYADFEEDIKKFKYIKRLFRRFETTGELKKHLILNHIILLSTEKSQIIFLYNTKLLVALPLHM